METNDAGKHNETQLTEPPDFNTDVTSELREIPMTKRQMFKNVLVLSLGFLFLFTAYQSMANLQTSLNKEDGVGAWSLSAIYVALIVSSMFLPKFVIARLGCKWTIPACMFGYALYMGANFYAVIWLMTVTGVILGIGAAPLWSAKCTYLTQIGVWYAKMTKQSEDAIINRFFGFFFMMFQTSQIWGNLISSEVFSSKPDNSSDVINRTESELAICGANFCPSYAINNPSFDQPKEKVYILCGIYLACAVLGFIVISLFLDPITLDQETSAADRHLSPRLLIATFKHLVASPAQMLLVPITVYSGVEQAFIGGDYTKSYISCTLGIWNIGYVMICYGVVDAICSFVFGRLVQYVGHIPFFVLATVLHGGLQIFLLLWEPSQDHVIVFYCVAALWGMGDAVIQTQINALYGSLFTANTEAAFANYKLWESVGFVMPYAYNDYKYMCTYKKLYVSLAFLGTGILGYTAVEVMEKRKRGRSADITDCSKGPLALQ
ncbi:hypothetical protein BaRGS_00008534 [Batillaria attramentaria]|uniref:UNC93-like protein n=1 Tax=Batillaria attramentaria TaxID=370345 RepID=A0ABD0LM41_9CAEN|nr:hypothetical protein BaRGS_004615 [Batillaria attramentaria]